MKKFSKALIALSLALSFIGCDSLYDATSVADTAKVKAAQTAADAKVADLDTSLPFKVTSWTKSDGSALTTAAVTTMTVSGTTVKADVINISGTGIEKTVGFRAVTFEFATKTGGTTNYKAGQIVNLGAADYSLVITSKDGTATKTYTVSINLVNVPSVVGAIGTAVGGWDNDAFKLHKSGGTLTAVATLAAGELKFRQDNAWTTSWGRDGAVRSAPVATGKTNGNVAQYTMGGDNIVITSAGLYFLQLNFAEKTIIVEPVTSIGIIGDATAGGWTAQTNFTWNSTTDVGTVTSPITAGKEMKIRLNDNWDIAFGGAAGQADFNGGNIATTAGSGVTLNGRTLAYTITP